MNTIEIIASARTKTGTKDAKLQRKEGLVPCVVYGGEEIMHVLIDEREFTKVLDTPETFLIKLNVDGTSHDVVLQDVQLHPVTDKVNHADFLAVLKDKPVAVNIPVIVSGQARGVLNGGVMKLVKRKLRLEGLVADIPEAIELDITKLRIGQSIRVSQISINGINFIDPQDQNVVAVQAARGALDDEEEEEEAAPAEGAEGAEGAPAEGAPAEATNS